MVTTILTCDICKKDIESKVYKPSNGQNPVITPAKSTAVSLNLDCRSHAASDFYFDDVCLTCKGVLSEGIQKLVKKLKVNK